MGSSQKSKTTITTRRRRVESLQSHSQVQFDTHKRTMLSSFRSISASFALAVRSNFMQRSILPTVSFPIPLQVLRTQFSTSPPSFKTINQAIKKKPFKKIRKSSSPVLQGCFQKKAVVLKTLIEKPKKPNSAQRKACRVRVSNGEVIKAYIPGEGHNLQEHSVVLIRAGRTKDLPGYK
jgi:small subunit ribosomal protein S12